MAEYSFSLSTLWYNIVQQLSYNPQEPLMFSSGLFWVLIIIFLPIYSLVKSRRTMMAIFVTLFSLFFFYKSSGLCFFFLLATSVVDWALAQYIDKCKKRAMRKLALAVSLLCSVGMLVYFKYANFLLFNFDAIVGRNFQPLDIILPVGISFYTFRTVSYVVDVYNKKIPATTSLLDYVFFLSFFPCLIAGPVVRASEFMPQLHENKAPTREQVYGGMWLIMLGIIKKAVFADYIAQYVNIAYGNPTGYSGVELLMAILGYSMQIYCDFSGYSDMAIGLGSMMGFNLGVNFDFPYRSLNVTEFWRRWHISLSFWLRDYIYISMGGNRKGKLRQYVNLMTTMLVGGLWHGAAWNFIIWGAGHGLALCVHKFLMPSLKKIPDNIVVKFISWLLTFSLVTLLFVFFRADSFDTVWAMLCGTVTRFDVAYFPVFLKVRYTWCALMIIIFAMHFVPKDFYERVRTWYINSWWICKFIIFLVVVQLVIEFSSADVQPLIYAQF